MSTGHISAFEVTRLLAGARLGRRGPLYLVHALTARCNARCGFCAWNPDFYDPKDQLPTEEIEQLYTDARKAGFLGVSVWGGEPLLHKDFERIMRHAKGLGLITNMVTNGFLLERKLDSVLPYVDRLCISLDHPSAEHDTMRKIPGLFDRIISATREVRRRDPKRPIVFICTLQKANVHPDTVREMAELMRSLGVIGVFNGMREEAASDTDVTIDQYAAPQEELSLAFRTVADLKRRGYPILNSHTHLDMMAAGPPVYRCHWPKLMLPIEANGDVVDCMHWGTRPVGNLRDTPLPEILKHPRLRELRGEVGEACHQCVSVHRIEISEVWEGNLEPAKSWAQLRRSAGSRARKGATTSAGASPGRALRLSILD
ncbi:MAG: radical SAM protein [Deltaproteobacteria bacterium]|nr:radical SAM protein [Deltaproteobacteria bacterium]